MNEIREYWQIIVSAVVGIAWLIRFNSDVIAWRIDDRGGLAAPQRRR